MQKSLEKCVGGTLKTGLPQIVLINQYYPPDKAATAEVAWYLAKTLAEEFPVAVVVGRPSYNPTEAHPWYVFRRFKDGELFIHRVGSSAHSRMRMTHRAANYLSFIALAIPRSLFLKADVIISMTDPPFLGIAVAMLSMLRRKIFLYSIQDLHPDMALAAGLLNRGLFARFWESVHQWALRRADRVVVLGEDMRRRIIRKGVGDKEIVTIRTGVSGPSEQVSPNDPLCLKIRCGFSFVAMHAGNLGYYGAWKTIIEAALLLKDENVGFVFVGEGAAKSELARLAAGCPTIRFLPFLPQQQVSYVLAAGDIQIVTLRHGLEGTVLPSKLYSILSARRAVLAVVPAGSDVAEIVRCHKCGIVVDPDNPIGLAESVRMLLRNRNLLSEMAMRAEEASREYDRRRQTDLFVRMIKETFSARQSQSRKA